ncbi:hypothetical protein BJV77DRAFT_135837 [Russula vinacea]|nr:hypothetical protein BJV77DRAFT_135837 [Russula vinacea]
MKGRREYGYGYGSSRTSFEDEADPPPPPPRKVMGPERGGRWLSQRERAAANMPESEYGEMDDGNELLPDQPGYGLSLWSRVATAASTLTISVSKAWASNIAVYSGEHTPPGEESRLTRALKAYHIEKARDPTDLPPWLFEEHERRPLGGSGTRLRYREGSEYDDYDVHRATAPPRSGGRSLRNIYDAAAATASVIPSRQPETQEWSRGRLQDDAPGPPRSKSNDRLKALRDARRIAAQRNAPVASTHSDGRPTYEERVEATDRIAETAMAHGVILLRCRLVFVRFAAVSYPHDGSYKRFSTV